MSEVKTNKISPASGTAITLGDSGDTFTVPSGATLTNSGTATGFGKVLQVVTTFKGDTFTHNTTTWTDVTGTSTTITPSSSSSKILVSAVTTGQASGGSSWVQLVRNIGGGSFTEVGCGDAAGSRLRAFGHLYARTQSSVFFIDEPATTSACIYKMRIVCESGVTGYIGRSNSDSDSASFARYPTVIVLQEISG